MPDVMTPAQRSRCMSRINSTNTSPELALRRALWRAGYRYRLRMKLPGRPDVVYPGAKLAVFVDGCFWHACPEHGRRPKSNTEYWNGKIERNVARDRAANDALAAAGWKVARFWEHEIEQDVDAVVQQIARLHCGRKRRKPSS